MFIRWLWLQLLAVLLVLGAAGAAHASGATSDPSAVSTGAGAASVFVRADDGAVWQRSLSAGTWSAWASIGGSVADGPRSIVDSNGGIWVFARGVTSGSATPMWARRRDPISGWQLSWSDLSHPEVGSNPVPVALDAGKVMVLTRRADGYIHFRRYSGSSWSIWDGLGPNFASDPAVAASGSSVWMFARHNDGTLWSMAGTSTAWSGAWTNLGTPSGGMTGTPVAVSPSAGVFQVFVRTGTGRIASRRYSGSWGAWEDLGAATASIGAATAGAGNLLLAGRSSTSELSLRDAQGTTWGAWSASTVPSGTDSIPSVITEASGAANAFVRVGSTVRYVSRTTAAGAWSAPQSLGDAGTYVYSVMYGGADSDINTGGEWAAAIANWEQVAGGGGGREAFLNGLNANDRAELPGQIQAAGPISYSCAPSGIWNIEINIAAQQTCVLDFFNQYTNADNASGFWSRLTPMDRDEVRTWLRARYPTSAEFDGSGDVDLNTGGEWDGAVARWEQVAGGAGGRTAFIDGLIPADRTQLPTIIQSSAPISYSCAPSGIWNIEINIAAQQTCVLDFFNQYTNADNASGFWSRLTPLDRDEVRTWLRARYPTSAQYDGSGDVDLNTGGEWDGAVARWEDVAGGAGGRTAFTNGLIPADRTQLPTMLHDRGPISYDCGGNGIWNIDLTIASQQTCVLTAFTQYTGNDNASGFWSRLTPKDRDEVRAWLRGNFPTTAEFDGSGDVDLNTGGEWDGAIARWEQVAGGAGGRTAFINGLIPADRTELPTIIHDSAPISYDCGGNGIWNIDLTIASQQTCVQGYFDEYTGNDDASGFWSRLTPKDRIEVRAWLPAAYPTTAEYDGSNDMDLNTGGEWDGAIAGWEQVAGGAGGRTAFFDGLTPNDRSQLPVVIQSRGPISYECGRDGKWNIEINFPAERDCVMQKFRDHAAADTVPTFWTLLTPLDRTEIRTWWTASFPKSVLYDHNDDLDIDTGGEWDLAIADWNLISGGGSERTAFLGGLNPEDREALSNVMHERYPVSWKCGDDEKWNIDIGVGRNEQCAEDEFLADARTDTIGNFWNGLTPADRTEVHAWLALKYPKSALYGDNSANDLDINTAGEWDVAIADWNLISGGGGGRTEFLDGLHPEDREAISRAMRDRYPVSWECGDDLKWNVDIGVGGNEECTERKFLAEADANTIGDFWTGLMPADRTEVHAWLAGKYPKSAEIGDNSANDLDINTGGEWELARTAWDQVKGGWDGRVQFVDGLHANDQRELNSQLLPLDEDAPTIQWGQTSLVPGLSDVIGVDVVEPRPGDGRWTGVKTVAFEAYDSSGNHIPSWSGRTSWLGTDFRGHAGCPLAVLFPCPETHRLETTRGDLGPGTYTIRAIASDGAGHEVQSDTRIAVGAATGGCLSNPDPDPELGSHDICDVQVGGAPSDSITPGGSGWGVSETEQTMFDDGRFAALGTGKVRYLAFWNVVPAGLAASAIPAGQRTPEQNNQAFEFTKLVQFMTRAHDLGQQVMLGFTSAREDRSYLPTPEEYYQAVKATLESWPWLTDLTSWNEINIAGEATSLAKNGDTGPKRAAQYWKLGRRACLDLNRLCTVAAGSFWDVESIDSGGYWSKFVAGLHGSQPAVWATHMYGAGRTSAGATAPFLDLLAKFNAVSPGSKVWMTEFGQRIGVDGVVDDTAGAGDNGKALRRVLSLAEGHTDQLTRFYYYRWFQDNFGADLVRNGVENCTYYVLRSITRPGFASPPVRSGCTGSWTL